MTPEHKCSPALIDAHERRIGVLERHDEKHSDEINTISGRVTNLQLSQLVNERRFTEATEDRRCIKARSTKLVEKMDIQRKEQDTRINKLTIQVTGAIATLQLILFWLAKLVD